MKLNNTIKILLTGAIGVGTNNSVTIAQQLTPVDIKHVVINDKFWSPS